MLGPEITYLYRQPLDFAQNTLEVVHRRIEQVSPALTNVYLASVYTVPPDHIMILGSVTYRALSNVVVPTPADQVFRMAVFATPPGVAFGTGPANIIVSAHNEFLLGSVGLTEAASEWSGEVWLRPGTVITLRTAATNADTINASISVTGLLIPKGNVSFA